MPDFVTIQEIHYHLFNISNIYENAIKLRSQL